MAYLEREETEKEGKAAGSLRLEGQGKMHMGRRKKGALDGRDGDGSLTVLRAFPCMDTVSDSEGRSQKKPRGDGALSKHLELAFVRKHEFAP